MEKLAHERLADLASSVQAGPLEARKELETLVTGSLQFTPGQTTEGKLYPVTGELALESMSARVGYSVECPRRPQGVGLSWVREIVGFG